MVQELLAVMVVLVHLHLFLVHQLLMQAAVEVEHLLLELLAQVELVEVVLVLILLL